MTRDSDQLHLNGDEAAAREGFPRAQAMIMPALSDELGQANGMSLSSYDVLRPARPPSKTTLTSERTGRGSRSQPSGLTRLVERLEHEGLGSG